MWKKERKENKRKGKEKEKRKEKKREEYVLHMVVGGGKTGTETTYESTQMSDLTDEDFKASIISMLKETKEALL